MSKLTLLVAVVALAGCANVPEQSAASLEAQMPQLVADCNGAADAGIRRDKRMRACETLANEKLLYLVEPAASSAYSDYRVRAADWQACIRAASALPNAKVRTCRF